MSLIVRPAHFMGESWPGYLNRLARANHLSMNGLAQLLGLRASQIICTHAPSLVLAKLGIEIDDVGEFPPPREKKDDRVFFAEAGRSLHTRICPGCISSMKVFYVPALWEDPFYISCERHQRLLVDRCPACKIPLSFERVNLTHCGCGFALANSPRSKADFDIRHILSGLSLGTDRSRATFAPASELEVHAVWFLHRLSLIQQGTLQGRRANRTRGHAFIYYSDLVETHQWFEDWPNGFIERLSVAHHQHRLCPGKMLGVGGHYLHRHFPRVAEACAEYDLRRRTSTRPRTAPPASVSARKRVSVGLKELMHAAGCSRDAVLVWIERGWLGDAHVDHSGPQGPRYFINPDKASRAIQICRSTAQVRAIARDVGFSAPALRALAISKVLQPISYGRATWNVRVIPHEVFDLAKSLLSVAVRGRAMYSDNIGLSKAICRLYQRHRLLLGPFIEAVISQSIPTRTYVVSPLTIEEVLLREIDLINWIAKMQRAK